MDLFRAVGRSPPLHGSPQGVILPPKLTHFKMSAPVFLATLHSRQHSAGILSIHLRQIRHCQLFLRFVKPFEVLTMQRDAPTTALCSTLTCANCLHLNPYQAGLVPTTQVTDSRVKQAHHFACDTTTNKILSAPPTEVWNRLPEGFPVRVTLNDALVSYKCLYLPTQVLIQVQTDKHCLKAKLLQHQEPAWK
jgi:hypothetical protein